MGYLNYEFFDEFKALDNLCRDIYGESIDNKLGVTLYLEDMDRKAYQGAFKVSGWTSDYNQLKNARNMRNELAHSRNSMTVDICSQEDIDFVRSFRTRILNQTDPIAMLRRQTTQPRPSSTSRPKQQTQTTYTHSAPNKTPAGCLGIVASFLILVACIIAFLISIKENTMGLFDKVREEKARRREYVKQELMALSEKELLVEILLELKELNKQSEKIKRNQVIWSD